MATARKATAKPESIERQEGIITRFLTASVDLFNALDFVRGELSDMHVQRRKADPQAIEAFEEDSFQTWYRFRRRGDKSESEGVEEVWPGMTKAIFDAEPLIAECTGWMTPPEIHVDRVWYSSETHHTLGLAVATSCFKMLEEPMLREALLPFMSIRQGENLWRLTLAVSRERMMVQRRYAPGAALPMSAGELQAILGIGDDKMTDALKACKLSEGRGKRVLLSPSNQLAVAQWVYETSRFKGVKAKALEFIKTIS